MEEIGEAAERRLELRFRPAKDLLRGRDLVLQSPAFEGMRLAGVRIELRFARFLMLIAEAIGFVDGGALSQGLLMKRNGGIDLGGARSEMTGLAAFDDFIAAFLKGAGIQHGAVGKHTVMGVAMNRA